MRTSFIDLRHGWRMLCQSPGFAIVAILVMALGIGANTSIFSVVDAVLLRPLPFTDQDRLMVVWEDATHMGFPDNTPAPANYIDWKKQSKVFDGMAALSPNSFNLTRDGEPERVEGYRAEWNTFSLLGVAPALGRVFLPEEDRPGGAKVAILSDGLWRRRYGADPGLIGREIRLNGAPHIVVGIMPAGFRFPTPEAELWLPLALTAEQWSQRGNHYLFVIGRLKPGTTLEAAHADMDVIARRLAHDYPANNTDIGARVVPMREQFTANIRRGLLVLLGAVGCVLLIACANVANLVLSRTASRQREIAVRTALGASRWRVARQLMTENLLLAALGGGLGVLLAVWSFAFLKRLIPVELSLSVPLALDLRVLAFTMFATVAAGLLFGLAPMLQAAQVDLNTSLKQGSGRTSSGRGGRLRDSLVVSEVALALVLLVTAVLLLRSFANLRGLDPGFRAKGVLSLALPLPQSRYTTADSRAAFFERVTEKLRALPGVEGVGFTSALPLVWKGGTLGFTVENRPKTADNLPYDANNRVISPEYMQVMGMRLVSGRFFDEYDGDQSQQVVIISETMARIYFPGQDALGKRVRIDDDSAGKPWRTVVGVARDVKGMGLDVPARPEIYFPYRQAFDNWMVPRDIVIRGRNLSAIGTAIRAKVQEVDGDQPIANLQTLDDILDQEVQQRRAQSYLLGAFAVAALALSWVGLYGVLSFLVAQRTREIGVRVALGASPSQILGNVLGRGLMLAGAGVVVGGAVSLALGRLLQGLLFEVHAQDPVTLFGVAATLLAIAAIASYLPAQRAMRVDPMVALRHE